MCGIYGCYDYASVKFDHSDLVMMGNILRTRGPDDHGFYTDSKVMLGHNRLSIIDLSPNGKQPMSNEDGSIWITYNGEIYNFQDIKNRLSDSHRFNSKTDTEVIIHAYEEMGEDLWKILQGMFAFALWDLKKKVFYLVRDHYGIKPLFYHRNNNSVIFSSQIKAILPVKNFNPRYNYQALSNYFSYFYIPGPETLIADINQLPPGSFMKINDGKAIIHRYTALQFGGRSEISEVEAIDGLVSHVKKAVTRSIISDVPVGIFLSGGMDSNILLAEMAEIYPDLIKTFTLGVNAKSYDESTLAAEVAEYFRAEHHTAFMSYENFDAHLTELVTAVDSINANPGLLLKYQFTKLAARHVKVALLGSGGDELFAGYPTYKANAVLPYLHMLPQSIRNMLLRIAEKLPVNYDKYSYTYVLKRFLEGSFFEKEKAHYWWRVIFSDDEKRNLFNSEITKNITIDASYKYIERFNETQSCFEDRALYSDFYMFLGDNDLILADQLGMNFSLEIRPPLLYQEFVDYACSIPFSLKFKNNQTKYLLRKAYGKILPEKIIKAKKSGVVAPLGSMFKTSLKEYIQESLSALKISKTGIFNTAFIGQILNNHFEGKEDNGYKIWCLLIFMKWNEVYLSKN